MKKLIYGIVILCLNMPAVMGQETNAVKQKLQKLDLFVGQWDVKMELRLSAQGPWETSYGKSLFKKSVGATIIEEDFAGEHLGKAYFTRSMFAVNNMTLKYQLIFVDSDHGVMIDYEGEGTDSSFTFDKIWTYANQSTVKLRTVFTIISKKEFRIENMRMPQGASSWDITGRKKYSRP
jgi:hypothetical protein